MKKCNTCNTEKESDGFYIRHGKLSGDCKECIKAKERQRKVRKRKPRVVKPLKPDQETHLLFARVLSRSLVTTKEDKL